MRISDWSSDVCSSDLTMALGLHWPGDDLGGYAAQKELRLFSLTTLSAAALLLLLREDSARQDFLYAIGVLGAAMTIAVAIEVAASDIAYRLGAFNTNPILLARATGFALLLLCLLYRSEEHTSELQSLMRISYAVF